MRTVRLVITTALLACSLGSLIPTAATAETTPFHGELRTAGELGPIVRAHRSRGAHATLVEPIEPLLLTAQVPTQGLVWFRFDRKWLPRRTATFDNGFGRTADSADPILLRGTASFRISRAGRRVRVRRPVTAAVTERGSGRYRLVKINFLGSYRGRTQSRFIEIEAALENDRLMRSVRVHAPSRFDTSGGTCGTMHEAARLASSLAANPLSQSAPSAPVQAAAVKIVQLSTEADFNWFSSYPGASNSEILTILNAVETIYESQLSLTFDIVSQNSLSSPSRYTTFNADDLLEEFQLYTETNSHLGNADLYHLFSGKDLFFIPQGSSTPDSSVIGLAFTGVVCRFPNFSYGLTENVVRSLNIVTTAHEIGHNFSADHTTSGIMTDTLDVGNPPSSFSATSLSQINSHVQSFGSCLAQSGATPAPTATPGGSATPRPTATPGGGGGGGGSGGGIDPDPDPDPALPLLLQAALTKTGVISVQVNLLNTDPACTVTILAADKQSKVTSGTPITVFSADFLETRYDIPLPRKTNKLNSSGGKIKVSLVGKWSCPNSDAVYSPTKSLNPSVITSKKKALSAPQWIRLLKNGLAAVSPVRE